LGVLLREAQESRILQLIGIGIGKRRDAEEGRKISNIYLE
jgi:hypothetical protein